MGLVEQKELTKEAALEIVYSAAKESFDKIAKVADLDYSPEDAKEAIMKQANTIGDIATVILGGPYMYAGKKIKENTGSTGKSVLYPGLVGSGIGALAGGVRGASMGGPKGVIVGGLGGLLGGGIGGAAIGGIGSLLKQEK